ncbi:hypothetical protein, partial [Xanthomonas perforans]|uniref:hypothetical protein n=1 Tax=Xanthomonas perforans TaxID=442694 RepID=UPI00115D38B9
GEVVVHDAFYSYQTKYISEHGAEIVIPADIDARILNVQWWLQARRRGRGRALVCDVTAAALSRQLDRTAQ